MIWIIGYSLVFIFVCILLWNPRRFKETPVRDATRIPSGGICLTESIDSFEFYSHYYGHPLDSIATLYKSLRGQGKRIIWLLGDSSLDNKHWICSGIPEFYQARLCNGYENVVAFGKKKQPFGVNDICFWLNHYLSERQLPLAAINCAVEASTLYDRHNTLLGHDEFVQTHLEKDDIIIVSIGGNDIVLNPSLRIIVCLFVAIYLIPEYFFSTALFQFFCLSPLRALFHDELKAYISRICQNQKPSQIILCSYYYPCINGGTGWADKMLRLAGYHRHPEKIQKLFDIIANDVMPVSSDFTRINLSTILSAEDETDYISCVEPSVSGGKKIAHRFCESLIREREINK